MRGTEMETYWHLLLIGSRNYFWIFLLSAGFCNHLMNGRFFPLRFSKSCNVRNILFPWEGFSSSLKKSVWCSCLCRHSWQGMDIAPCSFPNILLTLCSCFLIKGTKRQKTLPKRCVRLNQSCARGQSAGIKKERVSSGSSEGRSKSCLLFISFSEMKWRGNWGAWKRKGGKISSGGP